MYCWISWHSKLPIIDCAAMSVLPDSVVKPIAGPAITRSAELEAENADLRELLGWLDQAQQQQNDQLAADIHDQFGSSITALTMRLAALARQPSTPPLQQQWEKVQTLLGSVTQSSRQLQQTLRPAALEALGLAASLTDHAEQFSRRSGIGCSVSVEMLPTSSLELSQGLFRIIQQALCNIEQHADAAQVQITERHVGPDYQLIIADDGRGFDPAHLDWQATHGLRMMRVRAQHLKVGLAIISAPGLGCRIEVTLPSSRV
jgi:signal transduction histidine kinase